MLARTPKLNPPYHGPIGAPQPGTLTPLSSGTGVFAPIEWLFEINATGVQPGELNALIAQLQDQEAEEDMVSAWPDDTGLPNAIKILPGNPQHGPRIKVALNPTDRFTGDWAWVPFGEAPRSFGECIPCRTGGPLPPPALERQLHEFIERNRPALFAFDRLPDQGGISGVQLVRNLQKIGE
jgi:hypothetical protein